MLILLGEASQTSDYIRIDLNNKKITQKLPYILKIKITIINNSRAKKEIIMEI